MGCSVSRPFQISPPENGVGEPQTQRTPHSRRGRFSRIPTGHLQPFVSPCAETLQRGSNYAQNERPRLRVIGTTCSGSSTTNERSARTSGRDRCPHHQISTHGVASHCEPCGPSNQDLSSQLVVRHGRQRISTSDAHRETANCQPAVIVATDSTSELHRLQQRKNPKSRRRCEHALGRFRNAVDQGISVHESERDLFVLNSKLFTAAFACHVGVKWLQVGNFSPVTTRREQVPHIVRRVHAHLKISDGDRRGFYDELRAISAVEADNDGIVRLQRSRSVGRYNQILAVENEIEFLTALRIVEHDFKSLPVKLQTAIGRRKLIGASRQCICPRRPEAWGTDQTQ